MHPELIQIGSWTIRTYSVLLDLAIVLGVVLTYFEAKRLNFSIERLIDLVIVAVIGGVVGARLWFVAVNWSLFQNDMLGIVRTWEGGLVLQGAIVGALGAALIYAWIKHLPFLEIVDMGMPGAILAQAIGRVGCIFNGCCYGLPTALPWGLSFPLTVDDQPRQPTQIYELVGDLAILGILWGLRKRKPFSGFIFAVYLILYSLLRIFVEFFRGDPADSFGGLRVAQWVGVGTLVVGIIVMFALLWRHLDETQKKAELEASNES